MKKGSNNIEQYGETIQKAVAHHLLEIGTLRLRLHVLGMFIVDIAIFFCYVAKKLVTYILT